MILRAFILAMILPAAGLAVSPSWLWGWTAAQPSPSSTWNPSNIVGAYCWLNFSDTNMFTGASTSVWKVADWLNHSRIATNTIARSPSITNINNVTALFFNYAQSDYYDFQYTNAVANNWMIFLVCSPNDKTNVQSIFGLNASPIMRLDTCTYTAVAGEGGTLRRITFRAGSTTFYATNTVPPVVPYVLTAATWTNSMKVWLNNTEIISVTNQAGGVVAPCGIPAGAAMKVGDYFAGGQYFRGTIGEFGMVPYIDNSILTNAIQYLIQKWSITP